MGITINGGNGTPALKSYIPQMYSPELRKKFRDNTILNKITNSEFTGKFKNKGDEIIVRCLPNIPTSKFVAGQKIQYTRPESYDVKFKIDRGRYYAFVVDDVQKAFSDIPDWAGKWTDEGAKQLAEDIELEFFQDIAAGTKCHAKNTGETAGYRSEGYNIGTNAKPVSLYTTDAAATAGNALASGNKTTATELVTRLAAVLQEQPGGMGIDPFFVAPVWMYQQMQNSDLKKADMMGDSVSLLRKDACTSVGTLAGMHGYVSNLLWFDDKTHSGRKVYPILFGDRSAITFADEVSKTEVLRDKDVVGDFHRSFTIYDWFVRYPERFGVAFVVKGA